MQPLPPPPCRVKNGRIFHAFSRGLASRFVWMGIEGSLFIGSMHFVRAGILRKSKDAKKWDKEKTPWKFNIRYQKWWFGRFVFYQKWLFWISMLYKFTPPQKKNSWFTESHLFGAQEKQINPNHPVLEGWQPQPLPAVKRSWSPQSLKPASPKKKKLEAKRLWKSWNGGFFASIPSSFRFRLFSCW